MKRRLSLKIESAFPSMQKFQISYDRGLQESYTHFCVLSIVNGDSFLLPSEGINEIFKKLCEEGEVGGLIFQNISGRDQLLTLIKKWYALLSSIWF